MELDKTSARDMRSPGQKDLQPAYNYEPFAGDPCYVQVNMDLVAMVNSAVGGLGGKRIADVASGTGLIAKLCCDIAAPAAPAYVACSDLNPAAKDVARQTLAPYSAATVFEFLTADAQSLPLPPSSFDAAFGTNFIHMVKGKLAVVKEAARILHKGGFLAINTTFYDGCYAQGTDRNWRLWIVHALRFINDPANRLVVERDHVEVTAREHWPSAGWYQSLLEENGFRVKQLVQTPVNLGQEALKAIAQYSEFAAGAFHIDTAQPRSPEYVKNAKTALVETVPKAFPQGGVYRNWLQIVAQKA